MQYIEKTIKYDYVKFEIPKRCRKPRNVLYHDGEHTVRIPCYDEAPVVAVVSIPDESVRILVVKVDGEFLIPAETTRQIGSIDIPYHHHDLDELMERLDDDSRFYTYFLEDDRKFTEHKGFTLEGIAKALDATASAYAIVGGKLYFKVHEPSIEVDGSYGDNPYARITFNKPCSGELEHCYNINTDVEEAYNERFLGKYHLSVRTSYDLDILDPEAFTYDPQAEYSAAEGRKRAEKIEAVRLAIEALQKSLDDFEKGWHLDTHLTVTTPGGTEATLNLNFRNW